VAGAATGLSRPGPKQRPHVGSARSHSTGAVAGEVPEKLERSWSQRALSASTCSLWRHQHWGTTWWSRWGKRRQSSSTQWRRSSQRAWASSAARPGQ
jgi:spermidine synthase